MRSGGHRRTCRRHDVELGVVDPAKLAPFKVDDYGFTGMGQLLGAAGRAAAVAPFDAGSGPTTLKVWDLAAKTSKLYTLPDDHESSPPLIGLSPTHLWIQAAPHPFTSNAVDMYVRFALQ